MSRYLNGNNEPVIDDNACTFKPEDSKCKWLEDEVCCNGDCPMVGDFPLDACIVCGWWENEELEV